MSLLFFISMILLFVYVIVYVFDPILSKKKEFDYIPKKNDTFVKKMFLLLMDQKS